ncbi:MAG: phosphoglucosamine mutase [Candidatus Cloacimonetes bacterium]|nr:phosphoglucosamine mutase [Candidatus Cloacimonadota bacterium]
MSELMKSVSGVRGIFGENLTPELIVELAARFGIFQNRGKIVVGRDSRTSGPAMFHAVAAGLISVGCEVIDLGIVSTPTVLLAVEDLKASGGISITASHNPAPWNALKFVDNNGMFLYPEKAGQFFSTWQASVQYSNWQNMGSLQTDNKAVARHISRILNIPYLDVELIRKAKFKVVIDSVNGAGGTISPLLLRELGCDVFELNSEPSGIFAHNPEPLAENLKQLEQAVLRNRADIGFATDPDVDRLAIVSEQGKAIGEEYSLLLAEKFVLSRVRGDIVTNLSSSMASDDIAREFGVRVQKTPIGEINVGRRMLEINSPIGGEGNGGIICPPVHYTRDAPAGLAIILNYLAERKLPVSDLVAEIPAYYLQKEKLEVAKANLDKIMARAGKIYEGQRLDSTDGLKIIGDKYWIHIRKSGTEPILRVYVESDSAEKSARISEKVLEMLKADAG